MADASAAAQGDTPRDIGLLDHGHEPLLRRPPWVQEKQRIRPRPQKRDLQAIVPTRVCQDLSRYPLRCAKRLGRFALSAAPAASSISNAMIRSAV